MNMNIISSITINMGITHTRSIHDIASVICNANTTHNRSGIHNRSSTHTGSQREKSWVRHRCEHACTL